MFLRQYQRQRKFFLSERVLKKALRDTLTRAAWLGAVIFDWFVLSMRMQVILDSSFARPGSAPIWGGKKGEFRDWTIQLLDHIRFRKADQTAWVRGTRHETIKIDVSVSS